MNDHLLPDNKQLRHFGMILSGGLIVIFGLFFPWLSDHALPLWPWLVAGVLVTIGVAIPVALTPLYRFWMKLGAVLNWINTRLILGLVFFLIFTPVALIMRIFGRDALARRLESDKTTYRIASQKSPRNNLEKPF